MCKILCCFQDATGSTGGSLIVSTTTAGSSSGSSGQPVDRLTIDSSGLATFTAGQASSSIQRCLQPAGLAYAADLTSSCLCRSHSEQRWQHSHSCRQLCSGHHQQPDADCQCCHHLCFHSAHHCQWSGHSQRQCGPGGKWESDPDCECCHRLCYNSAHHCQR